MPNSAHLHNRPAFRDDHVVQAVIDLFDDIDAAQSLIHQDMPEASKAVVRFAVQRFRDKVIDSCIKDLTVSINAVGRLEVFLDYADDQGVIRTTYTSRTPIN